VPALACALALAGCSGAGDDGGSGDPRGQVRLVPDPPFAGARVTVAFRDPGLRPERCRFEWRRNGDLISEATTSALEPSFFGKGDRLEVTVFAPGAKPGGARRLRAVAHVANTPPSLTRVTVLPSSASGQAELRATPQGLDADGDSLAYTYRWFRNGSRMARESGPALAVAGLALGDQIAVEVVARDGEADSPPLRSDAVRIENRPPQFVSAPGAPAPADSVFRYRALATDTDRDSLRYELVSGPSGMTVTPGGMVSWVLPPLTERGGEHPVSIRAVDAKGGEATQQFTLRLGSPGEKR
jgi:hypothetical protein